MDIRQINDVNNSKPKEIYKENKSLRENSQEKKEIDTNIEKVLDNYGRACVSFGNKTQQNSSARKEEMKKLFFTLKNLKDENGNLRFDPLEINFVPLINPYNKKFFYQLLELKDNNGNYRFDGRDIFSCLRYLQPEIIDFIKELADKKDKNGKYRFDGQAISNIIQAITPENKVFLSELEDIKDEKGDYRFSGQDIANIIRVISDDNIGLIKEIAGIKDEEGNYIFSGEDIASITRNTNETNMDSLKLIINKGKDKNGNYRFKGFEIVSMLEYATPENANLLNSLLNKKDDDGNYRFQGTDIILILEAARPKNNELLQKLINDNSKNESGNYRLTGYAIAKILKTAAPENEDKIINLAFKKDEEGNFIFNSQSIISLLPYVDNIDKYIDMVQHQKAKVLEHPDLYINGQFDNKDDENTEINMFFKRNYTHLIKLFDIFDKETMNNLLRKRLDDAQEYIDDFSTTNAEDIKLFKSLCSSESVDGVPFSSEQKIDFLYIIKSYSNTKTDKSKIYEMLDSGKIDIEKLKFDLLKGIFTKCGMTDEEIAQITTEKFNAWDIDFIHLLTTSFDEEYFPLNNLVKSANLYDFNQYIQDESNEYGKVNSRTKTQYESHNMNYQAWLKPSQSNNVKFISNDKNKEQLLQIKDRLREDIEMIRQGPAKSFVDKQFAKYIINDKFVLSEELTSSKSKLKEFIINTQKQLEPVFKRAENNLNNPQKVNSAQNTLTVKNHLLQLLKDIESMSTSKALKTYDLTIKMWDRFPQKDLFQGNYSTCCIGIGGGNHEAMPHYLLNTAYNMIEFVDNKTGKTIGNALCYFITDANNKPAFIIDNIEIKNSKIPSKEVGIKLRTAITEYASKVAKEVTGRDDTEIYMSSSYNDVYCDDLKSSYQIINFLGDIDCDDIYMDLYNGWVDKSDFKSNVKLLKLK